MGISVWLICEKLHLLTLRNEWKDWDRKGRTEGNIIIFSEFFFAVVRTRSERNEHSDRYTKTCKDMQRQNSFLT